MNKYHNNFPRKTEDHQRKGTDCDHSQEMSPSPMTHLTNQIRHSVEESLLVIPVTCTEQVPNVLCGGTADHWSNEGNDMDHYCMPHHGTYDSRIACWETHSFGQEVHYLPSEETVFNMDL
eukprot:CAMPEP_0183292026 /NCGR_PEP_ID=MMETSP0160_2-20130417/1253_1 /TAXON_ID=2839 ORGANISM="Odontella Sinensis, Strain Grunow 1884" /NCGR_SAMPLE_ID=MMETSP0160_2 /ASSEMBLY_ACC=CAM_ASM_000250 /LENGTH=119 /DNA_ID=CAMNT_0025452933 /DNA_START=328 /DNA_END=687 /DNA_ORIENTATION=+